MTLCLWQFGCYLSPNLAIGTLIGSDTFVDYKPCGATIKAHLQFKALTERGPSWRKTTFPLLFLPLARF